MVLFPEVVEQPAIFLRFLMENGKLIKKVWKMKIMGWTKSEKSLELLLTKMCTNSALSVQDIWPSSRGLEFPVAQWWSVQPGCRKSKVRFLLEKLGIFPE